MHAAAAEAGGLADRVEPGNDLSFLAEHARVEIGLEAAQRLAGEDIELDRDQRPVRRIEDPVREAVRISLSPM